MRERGRAAAATLIVALAASCSGATTSDGAPDAGAAARPDFTSGSRLRARVVRADGVSLFLGWHDRVQDVDCAFAETADGAIRCVPSGPGVTSVGAVYLDAACTTPAISPGRPECGGLKLVVQGDRCNRAVSIGRVGTTIMSADPDYYQHPDGSCTTGSGGGTTSLTITGSLPLTAFVAAKKVDVPRGGRLAQTFLEAEDGSAQAYELIDTERKTSCVARPRTDRCVPEAVAWVFGDYTDPSCTTAVAATVAAFTAACGKPPSLVLDLPGYGSPWDGKGCGPEGGATFYQVGAPAIGDVYGGSASCSKLQFTGQEFYALGAPVPAEALPRLIHGSSGAGRIKLRAYADERGTRLVGYTLFDSARGEECEAALAGDGALRCMPAPQAFGSISAFYADAACLIPTVTTRPGCAPPQLAETLESLACGEARRRIYSVGAQITSNVYVKQNDTCAAAPLPKDQDVYAASEIAPSAFAPVEKTTE